VYFVLISTVKRSETNASQFFAFLFAFLVPSHTHRLEVECAGQRVSASLDGVVLATVSDASSGFGMTAFGSSWTKSWFDNFSVKNNTSV
jgi:hypothetical protein